jgi:hypothetical protein
MIPPIGPGGKPLGLLVVRFVVRFKEIRMGGDVFPPELLHHRIHFLRFIFITVWKHISELAQIELTPSWLIGIRAEGSPRGLVGDALRRNIELVSSNGC